MSEQVQQELEQMRRRLRDIEHALNASSLVAVIDVNGYYTYVNDKFCEISQYASHELVGKHFSFLAFGPHSEQFFLRLKENVSDDHLWTGEFKKRAKDGSAFWITTTIVPFTDAQGRVEQYVSVSTDITHHKMALRALDVRDRQFQSFISMTPDMVVVKDGDGCWLDANSFAEEVLGISNHVFLGQTSQQMAHANPLLEEMFARGHALDDEAWQRQTVVRTEEVLMSQGGEMLTFDTVRVPIYHADGSRQGLVVIARNITERKRAEEELRTTKEQMESFFQHTGDALALLDLNGYVRKVNRAFELTYGWTDEELHGRKLPTVPEKLEIEWKADLLAVQSGETLSNQETERQKKDGTLIHISRTLSPIRNDQGKVVAISTIERDITERMLADELLRKSEKLSVVGQLAAGIAHEIRNPLTSLNGFTQLLRRQFPEKAEYFDIMLSEIARINRIVDEFLMLSKPQIVTYKKVNVGELMMDVVTLLQSQAILSSVQLVIDCAPNMPSIWCDDNQIKQVFFNIVKNAIEASPARSTVLIDVAADGDDHVCVRCRDRGCGIDPKDIPNLGEPFFTTKANGTGLGLMVSFKIIESHNGKINMTSKVNEGTAVEVCLPVHVMRPELESQESDSVLPD